MSQQEDWTPLPAKWTPSSLTKWLDRAWSDYLKTILDTNTLSREEKNHRINHQLEFTKMVHQYIMNRQMTYKKEEK